MDYTKIIMWKKIIRVPGLLVDSFIGDEKSRYEARYTLIAAAAQRSGLRLYSMHMSWMHDREFKQMWLRYPENDKGFVRERHFNLYSLSKLARHVVGDSVECGVYHGAGSHVMMNALADNSYPHHIFDSFAGLSEPMAEDRITKGQVYEWKKHDLATPEEIVSHNLAPFPQVKLYKGWIPDRFDEVADRSFRLVHIDVDLYQPTLDCLKFFYPRTNAGGLIICDDYGSEACPGARKALDEFFADKPEKVVHITTGQAFVIKQ